VVFSVTFLTQMKVAALFGGAFFVIFYLNLFLASRLSSRGYWVDRDNLIQIPPGKRGASLLELYSFWDRWSSLSLPLCAGPLSGKSFSGI